jgi:acetyltransferase-like isoleucine patch superfamily enzyme
LRQECGPELPQFARFGQGSHIFAPFTISCADRIAIGEGVHIGAGCWLSVLDEHQGRRYDPGLVIGDGASLGPELVIACMGQVEIGARVLSAPRVFIGDTYHEYRDPATAIIDQPMADPKPVSIGEGAFLGIGAIVLPGVSVGERAYVAAGAVVVSDVPPNAVVAGNPARVVRRWDKRRQRWVGASPWRSGHRPARATNGGSQAVLRNSGALAQPVRPVDETIAALEQQVALAQAERLASDEEVKALQDRQEQTLALLADAQRGRSAAEHWLEDHQNSLSWRITAPLRGAKQKRLSRGRRASR